MIRDDLFSLNFLKMETFHGSWRKMQYTLSKKEDQLEVCIYPAPYNIEYTPEDKKEYRSFPFTQEGYEQAKDYLEEQAQSRDWEKLELK